MCNKKQPHVAYQSVPLFVHFSFSPMEISVTDFSAPIGASVLKIELKLHMKAPYDRLANIYINCFGQMIQMATTLIYGKNLQKSSSLEPKGQWH